MPESCPNAFKEWFPIVDALGSGQQVLLLRKGGIAEGPGGFRPEHGHFWLFPTAFHSTPGKLKPQTPIKSSLEGEAIPIRYFAEVMETHWLDKVALLTALDPHHLWAGEELAKRWEFGKKPGLYALLVRVFRLPLEVRIPDHPNHHGCKSWITLENEISTDGLVPVLDDATFETQQKEVRQALALPPCLA